MSNEPAPLVIREFANLDPAYKWRIDWLGDVSPHGPADLQNTIEVFLSPLKPDVEGLVTSPNATDMSRQVMRPVGVGYLPALYNGAVFQAGRPVLRPPEQVLRQRIKIAPAQSRFRDVKKDITRFEKSARFSGLELADVPLVQRSEYALGKALKNPSEILAISDINGIDPYYALIPCIEVARFFFCTSSVFARSLFAYGWEDLIWMAKCDDSKLPHQITIGLQKVHGLQRSDAKQLAYKFLGGRTQESIYSIRRLLQRTSSNLPREPLSCRFPFDDDTEIEAEVIKIPTGTSLKERYFVTRLLKCNRPIPFEFCYAYPQLHPGQGENSDDEDLFPLNIEGKPLDDPTSQGDLRIQPTFSNLADLKRNGELDDFHGAPTEWGPNVQIRCEEDRFEGLVKVSCTLIPKDLQTHKSSGERLIIPQIAEGMSTGAPVGSRPIASANINTNSNTPDSDSTIKILWDAVPILRQLGVSVEALPTVQLNRFSLAKAGARAWVHVRQDRRYGESSRFRSRLLLAILIRLENVHCVVADIERRVGQDSSDSFGIAVLWLHPTANVEEFLMQLASTVVQRKGWPVFNSETSTFRLDGGIEVRGRRRYHKGVDTAEELANKINNQYLATPPAL